MRVTLLQIWNWCLMKTEDNSLMKTEDNKPPELGTVWKHTNGNIYRVIMITNIKTVRPIQYPVTVVYENTDTGTLWSRPVEQWYRSFVRPGVGVGNCG